jgi:death-on-curing protein
VSDDPVFLTVDDVLALHIDQIREFGGSEGVQDQGGQESAVAQPSATYGGMHLHVGLFEMAATYAFHIAENHPFVDGNKRTALNAAIVFLGLNGFDVIDTSPAVYSSLRPIAEGAHHAQSRNPTPSFVFRGHALRGEDGAGGRGAGD